MEFKGTKGKWEVGASNRSVVNKDKVIVRCCFGENSLGLFKENEAEANALLISKAPIHLQELQELFEKLSNGTISIYNSDGGNISDAYKKHYNKLIEEATEI